MVFDNKEYARQMKENAVKDSNGNVVCSWELWTQTANIIENAPTVDAVEVLRCKDCDHYKPMNSHATRGRCKQHGGDMHRDDFCSYGERKVSE